MIEFSDVEAEEVLAAATASGGRVDVVRGGWHKADAIARFGDALAFPAWFGHNLDALADLLPEHAAERVAEQGGDWWLVWVPSHHLVDTHQQDYERIVDVLTEVAALPHARITVVGPRPGAGGARNS